MPKRTNDYQKLILAINNHFALQSAKVTESAMLFDASTEQYREIDILLEDEIGGIKALVGVECTTVKRPLTVAKLDEIIAKHKDCHINKTVIVSKFGFANTTAIKAQKVGVELIGYEAALQKDWPAEFDILAGIQPYHVSCELLPDLSITTADDTTLIDFDLKGDPLVEGSDTTLSSYLIELLAQITGGLMLPPYLNGEKAASDGVKFSQSWVFKNGITIKDNAGRQVDIIAAKAEFIYRRQPLSADLQAGIYNGKLVGSSVVKNDDSYFKESRFTVSKDNNGDPKSGISITLSLDT
ncbi:hypothetical protein JEU11_04975 [Paraglaciecola chathamensis]|uniref:Restriction endonuclease type IV Mrr domain-containing protein n=1 Tax=Paraglaciecola chathamensis TaxID=368405 RepID=A0ABS0WBF2_9ALTE|nr:hypothetical protein [Paraglaciecola chathamensis]MBJ2135801.1 hypothetical protein [Paraglaciecola chathamensis]